MEERRADLSRVARPRVAVAGEREAARGNLSPGYCSTIGSALENELQTIEDNIDKAIIEIRNLLTENQSAEDLQAGTLERRLGARIGNFLRAHRFQARFSLRHRRPQLAHRYGKGTLLYLARSDYQHGAPFARDRIASCAQNYPQGLRGPLARGITASVLYTASVGGTGHYGLAGMRERIRKIGGTLTLDTAAGKGTDIKIRIPLASH